MDRWNISDSPDNPNRRALRETMPLYLQELLDCYRCDEQVPGSMSRGGQGPYRHDKAVPFFHETGDYRSGGILFVFLCPNEGDLMRRRRMCTDFWRWQEQRGLDRASDWTNLHFHELLYAQFGLLQHQIVTMNAVLCAPPAGKDRNKPHERQMDNCLKTLAKRVSAIDPHIVIALGKDAWKALKRVDIPGPPWPGPNGSWSKPVRWPDTTCERWVFVAPHPAAATQGPHYRLHKLHAIWGEVRDGINKWTRYRLSPGICADLASPATEPAATNDTEGGLAYVINQKIRTAIAEDNAG